MKKTKTICFTIALLGAMAMLFSNCKNVEPNTIFNPDGTTGTVKDIEGNVYAIIKIGDQWWMAENLKTTQYRNGTPIENPTTNSAWQSNTTGAYAWYENDINWKDSYGALYNWHAINNTNGLCPTGWHVPSDAEWTQLVDYAIAQGFPNEPDDPNGAGNALKSCRQENSPLGEDCNTAEHPGWVEDDIHHGFDEFGFSGLPGGIRNHDGDFGTNGYFGGWWSNSLTDSGLAWGLDIGGSVSNGETNKEFGLSVRCIMDQAKTKD